jgi:ComF family protein
VIPRIFSSAAQDCVLCGAGCATGLVCAPCLHALPVSIATCPRCALPMPSTQTCGACLAHPPAFDAAFSRFEYRFPVDRLVRRFKFAGDLAVGRWLATALAQAVQPRELPDLVVAPPLPASRLRERGFNQALEIAKVAGRHLGIAIDRHALARLRETPPQPGLRGRERRENLRAAFACTRALDGRHVALVDDVMTTGATAESIARALKAAGASRVSVWTVARTPAPGA